MVFKMCLSFHNNFCFLDDCLSDLCSRDDFALKSPDLIVASVKDFVQLCSRAKNSILILCIKLNYLLTEQPISGQEEEKALVNKIRVLHDKLANLANNGKKSTYNQELVLTMLVDAFNQFIYSIYQ